MPRLVHPGLAHEDVEVALIQSSWAHLQDQPMMFLALYFERSECLSGLLSFFARKYSLLRRLDFLVLGLLKW